MMMIVRFAPYGGRAECKNPEDAHQKVRHSRFGQDRLMLLVVINHKEPQNQEPREDRAHHPSRELEVPKRPKNRDGQKQCSRYYVPPTLERVIDRIRFRR